VPEISDESRQTLHTVSNIYSIPPECNFLQVLVGTLLDGTLIKGFCPIDDPLLLSSATIFVPNRRAARALATAFVSHFNEEALLLPDIKTLGDVGDEDFGISADSSHFGKPGEEIKPLERTLLLANLVQRWVDAMEEETRRIYEDEDVIIPSSRADAVLLAQDLGILLSQITQEEIEWSAIRNIVPENHAQWWKLTTTFLNIIMDVWPEYLANKGLLDPADRAAQLLDLRTEFYRAGRNKGPVIIAGSTGSVASTRRLLNAVASLENGAVILPGLDKTITQNAWDALCNAKVKDEATLETHPQYGLAQLLKSLGVERDNVTELGTKSRTGELRQKFLGLALTPSDFTSQWITERKKLDLASRDTEAALEKITLIEAGNERQEATAITVAMREILEDHEKTAALVTPDRNLARRVSMELRRFDVLVDDTGGTPLKNSEAALFLRQIAQICFGPFQNSALAGFLKNPLCLADRSFSDAGKLARDFELVALRGVINQPQPCSFSPFVVNRKERLETAKHVPGAIKRFDDERWEALTLYCSRLDEILEPLVELSRSNNEISLQSYFITLANTAEKLSRDTEGKSGLLGGEGARELKKLFEDVLSISQNVFAVEPQDFPSVLDAIMKSIVTRQRGNTHPRLHIYGPLEVRLLEHDRVILGGLNEGTWPQTTRNDAFLNRVMRQELGMASPERRTGLAAHDFQQLMGKHDVFLSRSSRVDKSPTIASRWIQRLSALIGKDHTKTLKDRGNRYLQYADYLDRSSKRSKRTERPNPKPPVIARPNSLFVTDIETWIRDPYALYAKHILKLRPIDPLERQADALLKGTVYHAIMQDYVEGAHHAKTESERLEYLKTLADEHIADENLGADITHIWQKRFHEIAEHYVEWESKYLVNNAIRESLCEIKGSTRPGTTEFTLSAFADRIDIHEDGSLHIIDYKTGSGPSIKQAQTLSPQLALEGLIARQGGFPANGNGQVNNLTYMRLRRGSDFKAQSIANRERSIEDIINNAESELLKLIKGYQFEEQGYQSRRAPFKDGDITGDYDHLSRTREWSFGEDDGDDA